MDNLVIDRNKGTYAFDLNGQRHEYPSITEIIDKTIGDHRWATEEDRERGLYVHTATTLIDGGRGGSGLHWPSVHPDMLGYVQAYQHFKDDYGFVPLAVEMPVVSLKFRFCATLDRTGEFKKARAKGILIVELKSGSMPATVGVQTAAQWQAYKETTGIRARIVERMGIQLRADGTYRPHECRDSADLSTFLACKQTYLWNQKYGRTRHDRNDTA